MWGLFQFQKGFRAEKALPNCWRQRRWKPRELREYIRSLPPFVGKLFLMTGRFGLPRFVTQHGPEKSTASVFYCESKNTSHAHRPIFDPFKSSTFARNRNWLPY